VIKSRPFVNSATLGSLIVALLRSARLFASVMGKAIFPATLGLLIVALLRSAKHFASVMELSKLNSATLGSLVFYTTDRTSFTLVAGIYPRKITVGFPIH
jgi:hypothetical protein